MGVMNLALAKNMPSKRVYRQIKVLKQYTLIFDLYLLQLSDRNLIFNKIKGALVTYSKLKLLTPPSGESLS